MKLKYVFRRTAPLPAILAWKRFQVRALIREWAKRECFADVPVDLRKIRIFRRESFPGSGPVPWLDRDDALARIDARLRSGEIDESEATLCREWRQNGVVVLPKFFDHDTVDEVWAEVERWAKSRDTQDSSDTMSEPLEDLGDQLDLGLHEVERLHVHVPKVANLLERPELLSFVRLFLGRDFRPFQTMALFSSSQGLEHTDAAQITTYPEGYQVTIWVAMEDVHPDSGPLLYYPGSHRLPFYSARDVGMGVRETLLDFHASYHGKYEPFIQDVIRHERLQPVTFTARKGDVLLWHGNLLHRGNEPRDPTRSRKSLVCQYYAQGAVCYHDLPAGLARLD